MTQIRSVALPTRRAGELGVHSLDHFDLTVPDLKVADHYYGAFGLDLHPQRESLTVHTAGGSHCWGRISEGPRKKLNYLSFGAFADDVPAFKARLEALGVKLLDPPPGVDSAGLWFRNPDGLLIEIKVAEKSSPNEKSSIDLSSAPAGAQGAPKRSQVSLVRPRRLAHILIFTSDVGGAIEFYTRTLGLRLSDRSGDGIAFMHGIHGSDHHLIALARAEGTGLHHLSWDVSSVNEIGLGAMQMADRGFAEGWGLGRHVLGSNFFHYVRDPWGSYAEFSCDIDYIPVNSDWEAGDHAAEDAFYVWGPRPPQDFAFNYESASSSDP